ncbi:MAG: HAD-IIB family hydrolase [Planctomycetaceae bacterium]
MPKFYTWETHCEAYLSCLKDVIAAPIKTPSVVGKTATAARLSSVDALLITDIDNTLLGDDDGLRQLLELLRSNHGRFGFGIASGRALELIEEVLHEHGIHDIDVIVAAVGAEIYYGRDLEPDKGWASRLRHRWYPNRIREALAELPFVAMQAEPHTQREFKLSYDLSNDMPDSEALPLIHAALDKTRSAYSLIFSHGSFIDILPHRASKGKAVRYLAQKWNLPLERIATAGDSGNDRDMLTGQTAGIVVGNHSDELADLKDSGSRIYFANGNCANGILDGLEHFGLLRR